MRLGLVLGAGGTAGEAFHRGVLRAMQDLGLDPRGADVVVGTSAGSLVAASLRRHGPARPAIFEHRSRARLPERGALLDLLRAPRRRLNAALLWPEFTNGRRDTAFISEGLRRAHGVGWSSSALWVVAVRRRDGHRVVFGRPDSPVTDVGSAVAASCAIPGYFAPVRIDGVEYVDGGVYSPTNADLLADCDLDLAVVSSPMSVDPRSVRLRPELPVRLWFQRTLREEVWTLRRSVTRVVTIEPDHATIQAIGLDMMSGHRVDEIEDHAYAHARSRLAEVLHDATPLAA